jgi:tetratricopeptide (TPR) repeat protein
MVALLLVLALAQSGASGSRVPLPDPVLVSQRDTDEAALRTNPADAAAQADVVAVSERLALQARSAHDMNGALGDLLRAQSFAPENTRMLYDLGVLEEQIGLYHDANATVAHLRKLSPADPKVDYLAARVELDLGRLGDAERDMRAYLKVHPEDVTAHYGLGRILQQGQQAQAAKAEFEKAIALKPVQTESYYQLAQLALDAGDFQTAIEENAKVLARDPRHGGALTGTGIAYFRLKKYAEAQQSLQQAVTAAPEYQLGHYYYGLVLARLGKKEESARELALAAKMADEANRKESQRLRLTPKANP